MVAGGDTSTLAVRMLDIWGLSHRAALVPGAPLCRAHSDDPRLDGIEACAQLRADETTAGATIVMLTATSRSDNERRAEEAGADLFLTKPFSPLDLLRLVDQMGS